MPYLMHIAFDNPLRLARRVHYLTIEGVRFKLIQNNPRKWADVLITIRPSFSDADVLPALRAAGTFASAFTWRHHVGTTVRHVGGPGIPKSYTLRTARCRVFESPTVNIPSSHGGQSLTRITHIENDLQRSALAMYREALSSNKTFLSVLLKWQILEVDGTDAVSWCNRLFARRRSELSPVDHQLSLLGLRGRRLGEVLQEEYRHAIAHLRRSGGRRAIQFDDDTDCARVNAADYVLDELVRIYVRERLQVSRELVLARRAGRAFPAYFDDQQLRQSFYRIVR